MIRPILGSLFHPTLFRATHDLIQHGGQISNPGLLEKVVLSFPGVSPEVSGSWIVKQAVHEFDADAESYNTSGTAEMKE